MNKKKMNETSLMSYISAIFTKFVNKRLYVKSNCISDHHTGYKRREKIQPTTR